MDLYNLTNYYWSYSQYHALINDTLLNILKYTSFHPCLIIFWKQNSWINGYAQVTDFWSLLTKSSSKCWYHWKQPPLVEEYYSIAPPVYFGWSDVLKKVHCFVCANLITRMFSISCCWLLHCLLDKLPVYDFCSFSPSIKTILPLHIGW